MAQGSPVFSASLDPSQLAGWIAAAKALVPQGRIPDYIPGLGKANPNWLALKVHLSEDWVYQTGEVEQPFVLMSVIKPFVLLYLLERFGAEQVFSWVGIQPSEYSFHSVQQLKADQGFPRNPMINSGALALAGHIPGLDGKSRCRTLYEWLNQLSGAHFYLDEEMLASVRSVGNETNRTIAKTLAQSDYLDSVDVTLDTYNQICCLAGTVDDLVKLGLLLACPNPQVSNQHRRLVNALMLTCGLYEASGKFAVQIGLPTKSGVSGAMLSIVPGQGAISCYSPVLDHSGNSLAGLFLLEKLAQELELSIFG
jgi:glutaminase